MIMTIAVIAEPVVLKVMKVELSVSNNNDMTLMAVEMLMGNCSEDNDGSVTEDEGSCH